MNKKLCVFLLIALFVLTGCKNKDSKNNNQEKIEAELEYIDTKIFSLSDKLNNLYSKNYELISKKIEIKKEDENSNSEGSEEGKNGGEESSNKEEETSSMEMDKTSILDSKNDESEIDWKDIKIEIEGINSLWSIISIDLKSEKVADNDIEEFNSALNETMLSIKDENKAETLKNVTKLYSFIPTFMNYISKKDYKTEIKKVKVELLRAYTEASLDNWDSVPMYITNAQNAFFNMQKDTKDIEEQRFKIDKVERLIQNLDNSSKVKELQVFLVHYKTVIENINTI